TVDQRNPEQVRRYGVTVPALGPELENNYPQVVDMVRLHRFVGQVVFKMNDTNFQERDWYMTDPNFFDVFDFKFISGDKSTALDKPFSLVLTESTAKKYFGDKDPVGEIIAETSFGPVTVTGVIEDLPENSHLQFNMLFSQVRTDDDWSAYINSWENFGAYTYIVLNDANSFAGLQAEIPKLEQKRLAKFDGGLAIAFQPMEDIYLHSEGIEDGTESSHGRFSDIYIFSSMGLFLLLIASVNYINLATSKAMVRAREIGVRKVVGAKKTQLVVQFLMESFIVTFISAVLAIFVMDLCFPYFNLITGKEFDVTWENLQRFVSPLLIIAVVIGLLSGAYPAFYLARMEPVSSLRGRGMSGKGATGLRRALVVFQFVLTIVMIVSTLVIGRQMNFIRTKDIGFNKDRLMVVDINSGNVRSQFRTMKNEYSSIPGVVDVSVSTRVPGEWKKIPQLYVSDPATSASDSLQTYFMGFDEDMLATYQISLASGRYFSSQSNNDSTNILLNESAVRALGLAEPVGAVVKILDGEGDINMTVIGVVRDFNFQSLHQKVAPIIIGAWNTPFGYIDYFTLKIEGRSDEIIEAVTRVHEKFDQRTPIEYHFLDQQLESYYANEKRSAMIFRMGGALSIFVACLGLFGLATYNIQRRTKELGIRKVLGASGLNLFLLLSSSFAKQVGVAFLIATPFAWYIMKQWLQVFEYRISLHVGTFILAGLIALLIALATISYRTVRATRVNPVNSLRQE
ncbi:MAG TPA: ABC transporter permease, partial [Cyclobacteriaceae bacterium]|nr:ABC transporter permease [Cyclobacteriaceae bacterium]